MLPDVWAHFLLPQARLLFDTGSPELRITSERIAGRFLLVFPDIGSDLVIEIKPAWSAFASINGGLRVLPMLTADAWVERVGYEEVGAPAGDIARVPVSR